MPDRPGSRRYPRTARVNEVLREILAEELREIDDDRLRLATVTAVDTERDLRHARVYLSSLGDEAAVALEELRPRLQAAIAHQARLRRTPRLSFAADPAVSSGGRIEEILRELRGGGDEH